MGVQVQTKNGLINKGYVQVQTKNGLINKGYVRL